MKKYSRGRRGAPAKGIGRETGARVQIPPSSPVRRSGGVAVNMPPCHGGDRGFDSRPDRHCRCSSMVERDLAKVDTRVRFPSSAPLVRWCSGLTCLPVTEEIAGSIPVRTAINICFPKGNFFIFLTFFVLYFSYVFVFIQFCSSFLS